MLKRRTLPESIAPPDLVPLETVAARLHISPHTAKQWRKRNGLPLIRLSAGGGYYALWSSVEAWARSFEPPQVPPPAIMARRISG